MKIKSIILMLLCLITAAFTLSSCNEKESDKYSDLLAPKSTLEKDIEGDIKWPSELFPDEFPIFTQNVSSLEKEEYAFILKVKDINYKEYDSFIQRITDRSITNLKRITGVSYYDRYFSTYIYEKDGKSEAFMIIYNERNEYSFCIMGTKEEYYPDGKIVQLPIPELLQTKPEDNEPTPFGEYTIPYREFIDNEDSEKILKMQILNIDEYENIKNEIKSHDKNNKSELAFIVMGDIFNTDEEGTPGATTIISNRFSPDNESNFYEIITLDELKQSDGWIVLKGKGLDEIEAPAAVIARAYPIYWHNE